MKKAIISFLSVAVSLCFASAQEDYDVYILLGQSNAVGFAPLEKGDELPVEGCYLLDSEGGVVPMSGVANRFSSLPELGKRMGYSLGVSFARRMHEVTGRKILLVSNAKGATTISQWLPTAENPLFYNEAVRRGKQAQRYGTIKGILWHQGCGDARWTGQYTKRAGILFGALRRDFGDENLPVVVGEVGHWLVSKDGTVTSEGINEVLRDLPLHVPSLLCVTSEGCNPIYDNIHFNHEALEIMGRRYAAKMLSFGDGLLVKDAAISDPSGVEVFIARPGWYHVYARPVKGSLAFRVKVGQQLLGNTLSPGNAEASWEYAGKVFLRAGVNRMGVSCGDAGSGCCDALWITSNEGKIPRDIVDIETTQDEKK